MKMSQRIAKNAAFGLFAAVVGGGLQFVSIIIVARFLGLAEFGVFSYLLAFASVFQFMADFGLSNILVREMARYPDEMGRLLCTGRSLLWLLFTAALVVMTLVLLCLPMTMELKLLSLVMGLGYLFLLQSVSYVAVLRATEDMEYNAIGFVAHKVVLVGLLLTVLLLGGGIWAVVACHFTANVFQWGLYSWFIKRRYQFKDYAWFIWDPATWKFLIIESVPLGGGLVMRQCTWQLEIFLLTCMSSSFYLGLFSGPYRFLMGLNLLSAVLTLPLFPMFIRLARESRVELEKVYQRAVRWFYLLSLPIMAVCLVWPQLLIGIFLGKKFMPAMPALQLLSFAVVPLFISMLFPFLYSALDMQKWYLLAMATALMGRLVLGFFLISHFGYLGACISVAVAEIAIFVALACHLSNIGLRLNWRNNLLKPFIAIAVVMAIFHLTRHLGMEWLLLVGAGSAIVYGALLWRLQVFSDEDITHFREAIGFVRPYLLKERARV